MKEAYIAEKYTHRFENACVHWLGLNTSAEMDARSCRIGSGGLVRLFEGR